MPMYFVFNEYSILNFFEAYKVGEKIHMECKNASGLWTTGPICKETGEQMYFLYGVDTQHYCGWEITDAAIFTYLRSLISRDGIKTLLECVYSASTAESWSCRIRIGPDHEFYVPFTIPIWGIVEPGIITSSSLQHLLSVQIGHVHVDNHLNFVFHGDAGKIVAATAYPGKDSTLQGSGVE
jgi:hypothetical protein